MEEDDASGPVDGMCREGPDVGKEVEVSTGVLSQDAIEERTLC